MGSSQRRKGAVGEREVCRLLREGLGDGWTVERFGTGETGHDIRVSGPTEWPWAVEVKRHGTFRVGEVLRGPSARWLSWWRQAEEQAQAVGRHPLLLCRGDGRPWWAFVAGDVCWPAEVVVGIHDVGVTGALMGPRVWRSLRVGP